MADGCGGFGINYLGLGRVCMNICNKQVLTQLQMIDKYPKSSFTNVLSSSYPISRDVFMPNTNLYIYTHISMVLYIHILLYTYPCNL